MQRVQRLFVAIVVILSGCNSERETARSLNIQAPPDASERAVRAVISELLKVDSAGIPMDMPISDPPLKADDLDLVEIVLELEERLGIEIPDADLKRYAGKLAESLVEITPNQLVAIVRDAPKAQQPKRRK
jgi:acyl carrier protein